jgi:hypothetical protein
MNTLRQTLITITSTLIIASFINACSDIGQSSQVPDLQEDELAKEEVFDQILANQDLFNDFMNEMMQHQQSMNWMMDHNQMMQHMFSTENMKNMMEHNSGMRDHMMQGWMNMMRQDTSIYNQMNHMMGRGHMDMGMSHMHQ